MPSPIRPSAAAAAIFALAATLVAPLGARLGAQDSTAARRPGRDTLETVVITATRAGSAPPTTQTTLTRAAIERTYVGQDAPLALQGITGVTAASDAGAFSGYSNLRLRGIDQTRLAISVDGVPLNDPEDQVLYFSNVPDFMNSMESVRVQRGVGGSGFGPAGFAGSLSFESVPLATTARFAEAQLTGGSWGTRRASVEGATGLTGGVAAYGRVSGQETDGYRRHSGNRAQSAFGSAAWFGARDVVKVTGFAGRSRMQLAYYAPSEAELAIDPRANPMSPRETDDFQQAMASVQHTRTFGATAAVTTTLYRNSAGGAYDVLVGDDLWNFQLDHVWYGLLSTVTWTARGVDFAAGAHVSDYAREHALAIRPALDAPLYDNTGHKQEQSGFLKAAGRRGAFDWSADLQLRRAAFRYAPTPGSGGPAPSIAWTFANPKVGASWRVRPGVTLFASAGRAGREPTRSDLFAGADDLDAATAAEVLPLTRVRPERLTDIEAGVRLERRTVTLSANAFAMRFRDEIAPIGAIAITGSPLRRNVARSARDGVEVEAQWRARPTLEVTGNLMLLRARIAAYTDEASGVTYRDVPPLLTPAVIANAQAAWRPFGGTDVTLGARHVGRSHLANDGDETLVTPAFTLVDLGVATPVGGQLLHVQVQNLFDATAYAAGYTDGTTRFLFPVAGRTLLATVQLRF